MGTLKQLPEDVGFMPVNKLLKAATIESLSEADRNLYDKHMQNAEGKAEASREMAKKFLESGVDINVISKCTGLSIDELNAMSS